MVGSVVFSCNKAWESHTHKASGIFSLEVSAKGDFFRMQDLQISLTKIPCLLLPKRSAGTRVFVPSRNEAHAPVVFLLPTGRCASLWWKFEVPNCELK